MKKASVLEADFLTGKNKSAFCVFCVDGMFFVDEVEIVGVTEERGCVATFTVEGKGVNQRLELPASAIYDNRDEAWKECNKAQRERGMVKITQKQYDEYMELKSKIKT